MSAPERDPQVAAPGPRRLAHWGPRAVTLGDQVLSSVSNVLAVMLVARAVSAEDFGTFALGYSVMTLVLALTRSYFGTRVSLATDPVRARAHTRDLAGGLLILALPMVVIVFVVSRLMAGSGAAVGVLVIVAIATPIVCVQDVLRYGAVASGRPMAAVWSDGTWVVMMLVPFVLGTRLEAGQIMSLWLLAAVVALVIALLALRLLPDLVGGWAELKTRHSVGEASTWSAVIGTIGALWILFMASAAISPTASGSLRGAATTMGPVNVLLAYVGLGLTPLLVRRARGDDARFCLTTTGAMVLLTGVWAAILLLIPTSLGQALFGASWTGIRSVLPITSIEYVLLCVGAGAILGMRVRHLARDMLYMKYTSGVVVFVGGAAVAFVTRSTLAIAALTAFAALVGALVGWALFLRSRPADVPTLPAEVA